MATSTTNLGLTKPAGTDKIRIAQINGNMDILDEKIGAVGNTSLQAQVTSQNQAIANVQNGLAYIVGNTNTTGSTLAVGQFVYVKGHSTIAEGLYKVTASISANGSITTSNTTAVSGGGLNELNSKLTPESKKSGVTANTSVITNVNNLNFVKTGNVMQISGFLVTAKTLAKNDLMMTLPDDCKPAYRAYGYLYHAETSAWIAIVLATNGQISVDGLQGNVIETGTYLTINETFVTA